MAQLVHDLWEVHHSSQHHTHMHCWPRWDIMGGSAQHLQTGQKGDDICGQERRCFGADGTCMKRQPCFGHCCWTLGTAMALSQKQSSIFAIGMVESVLALGIWLQLNPCADAWVKVAHSMVQVVWDSKDSSQASTGCAALRTQGNYPLWQAYRVLNPPRNSCSDCSCCQPNSAKIAKAERLSTHISQLCHFLNVKCWQVHTRIK